MKSPSYYYPVLILLISFLGSGCIGRTPQAIYYTLTPLKGESAALPSAVLQDNMFITIDSVKFPDELARPSIITRSGPNQLAVDEFHRWAGRLEKNFTRVMAENLAYLLKTDRVMVGVRGRGYRPDVRITIDIREFTGQLGEYALLSATWSVFFKATDLPPIVHRSVVREPVSDQSYDALVAAQSRAVFTLSREIAGAVLAKLAKK